MDLTPDTLATLADRLAEAHPDLDHAVLVRIRPKDDEMEVGTCALPAGVHPAAALLGHTVPDSWPIAGVICPARARPLDDENAEPTKITAVMLVGRDGSSAAAHPGVSAGEDRPSEREAPVGRIPDLIRRSLGLPTEPMDAPAAALWRTLWLVRLCDTAAKKEPVDVDRPLTSALGADLVQAIVDEPELASPDGWERIRSYTADTIDTRPGPAAIRAAIQPYIEPAEAAWLDAGSFARWLLDAVPSADDLLATADDLLPPDVRASIDTVLAAI